MHRVLSCTVISVIGTRGYFPRFSSPRYIGDQGDFPQVLYRYIGDQGDIFPGSVPLDNKRSRRYFLRFSKIYRRSRRYFPRFSSPRYIGDQGDIFLGSPRYIGDQGDIFPGSVLLDI